MAEDTFPGWHGTTIIAVRKGGEVVVAGDGQVSLGQTVIKGTARKVRRLTPGGRDVVAGFAGSTLSFVDYVKEFPYFADEVLPRLARAGIR